MSEQRQHPAESGPPHRLVEIGVALFMVAFGAIVIVGSLRVGVNWGVEGPRAGFFPFYIGLFILVASIINLFNAVTSGDGKRLFATWDQLRKVTSVVVPTGIYVLLVPRLGIYVSSALLIGAFMKWLGGYGWLFTLATAIVVPIIFFIVFERWFLIPLPKGPVEDFVGL
jgi:putative tricarboxylic transport membrane protein